MNNNINCEIVCISDIIGKPVMGINCELLGVIGEIVLGQIRGDMRYIVLTKKSHQTADKLFAIPWGLLNYDKTHNAYKLSLSNEILSKMPTFDINNCPNYAPTGYAECAQNDGLDLSLKQKIHKESPAKMEQERFISEGGNSQPLGVETKCD